MKEVIIIKQPITESQFDDMFDLRWRVLRKPWNQSRGTEKDDNEYNSFPFIIINKDKIIGTARLQINNKSSGEGQIRYLAIEENYRRLTLGKKLILHIEDFARKKNLKYLILNARKTAFGFFKKLDYEIIGEGPTIFNVIEHYVMKKRL